MLLLAMTQFGTLSERLRKWFELPLNTKQTAWSERERDILSLYCFVLLKQKPVSKTDEKITDKHFTVTVRQNNINTKIVVV